MVRCVVLSCFDVMCCKVCRVVLRCVGVVLWCVVMVCVAVCCVVL